VTREPRSSFFVVLQRLNIFSAAVLIGVGLLLSSSSARAQLTSASVNGTVQDSSGAVIEGAQLTLRNASTGTQRETTTNSTGNYAFLDITPGTYTLEVVRDGFATAQQSAVMLSVNQTAKFNFTLTLGLQVQQVTVSAAAAQLETATANLGTVFNKVAVNDLPLNGRNFTQLLTLAPGSSPRNVGQNASGINSIFTGTYSFPAVNGQSSRSNFFLLDGINNQQYFGSEYAVPPIVDAIEEFKMQSHNDQSQFGGVLGGIVNVVTKSGTDHYHGNVWEFLRNDALDAQNPFLTKKTPLKQNVYGATIGGPMILPYYGSKHHTFFFGAYEGTSINTASQALYNVPTIAELTGDFSAVTQQIYDPFSTVSDPNHPGQYLRTPFPQNQIPQSLLDPHMVKLAQELFPKPLDNLPSSNGQDTTPTRLWQNNYSLRLDQQINQSNMFWARLSQFHVSRTHSGGFVGLNGTDVSNGQNWGLNYVHTFGSSATLQIGAGHVWQDYKTDTAITNRTATIIADSGYENDFGCNFIGPRSCQLPIISIPGYLSGGENYGTAMGSNIYEYKADFTKLIGRHMVEFGAEVSNSNQKPGALNANGNVNFSAFQTSNLQSSANTGNAAASFLLGVPVSGVKRNISKDIVGGWVDSFYAEDQWKLTQKLTMNWGVRYDMILQPYLGANASKSNLSGSYDFSNGTYLITKAASELEACVPQGAAPCIPGGALPNHVAVASGNKLINDIFDNIQPRIGFAYQATPKAVLHVSYGRVYDTWSGIFQSAQNEGGLWPSVSIAQSVNLNSTTPTSDATAENPLGSQVAPLPAATPFNQVAYFVSPNMKNAYSDQWLVGLQQQVSSNTVWTLNYVGSVSSRLPCCDFYNVALTPGPGTPQSRAPYPYIKPTHYEQSTGSSNYNSLQTQLSRHLANGLAYTFNYTWSKAIDVACDGWYGVEGCFVRNPYNPRLDRSVAGFDLTNMFTGTALYQLPFGTGRQFNTSNRALDAIIGGWQLNAIVTLTSGNPYTVSYSGDKANTGNNFQGVDVSGNPQLSNKTRKAWFNTAAFQTPAQYTYGNSSRNSLRSDWYRDVDLSLFRTFSIEQVKVEFRAEAFNVTNTVVYGTPNATLNSITFGQVLGPANTARQLQLGGKIYF
jgi:hypothetical protein